MRTFKRRLASNHAASCQAAKHKVCKCRCQGKLHGHSHQAYMQMEQVYFTQQRALGMKEVSQVELDLIIDQIIAQMQTTVAPDGSC